METLRERECFDADTGKDLAVEVREYFIPDFTHWKDHDSFERAFARFLKDLQATEAPPTPRTPAPPGTAETSTQRSDTAAIDYEHGLDRMREMVQDHPFQGEFATLAARLYDILHSERLYGSSENTRAGKAQVVHALNHFVSSNGLAASFTELCFVA
jgi:hypothetical protein